MTHETDLFGKTFDQQVAVARDAVTTADISPNRRVPGEMVFEPMGDNVRVTARDEKHRVLWGYVGSKETLDQIHCLVAVYETLQDLLAEELAKRGVPTVGDADPIEAAKNAIKELDATLAWIKGSLDVKKVSDATLERATLIARIVSDADRQIKLEAETLKGMKSRA